ncbi:MAG TPA: SIMPL domain-containing protein [Chthoniobacterales bacterium]
MNSIKRLFLRMPTVRLGVGRAFFGLVLGLGLVIGAARAEEPVSPAPSPAAPVANPSPGKINLEATARKRLPNTAADVVLGIQVDGRNGDAVSSSLAQKSQTLVEYLRKQGVERLRTENVNFQPQVESPPNGPDKIVGYTGTANVSFRTTADKLGTVLSGSLENGANTVSQTQFTPSESEIDAARRDLGIEATKTALARADAIAEAAGLRVVRVETINVAGEENVVPLQFAAKVEGGLRAAARPVQTVSGEQEVSVRVSVQVGVSKR